MSVLLKVKAGVGRTLDEGDNPTFNEWMARVDKLLGCRGLHSLDLPDCCYRDWYDDRGAANPCGQSGTKAGVRMSSLGAVWAIGAVGLVAAVASFIRVEIVSFVWRDVYGVRKAWCRQGRLASAWRVGHRGGFEGGLHHLGGITCTM
jgi:hypothetical protein